MIMRLGGTERFLLGTGMKSQIALQILSILYLNIAEIGIIGDLAHLVYLIKFLICL